MRRSIGWLLLTLGGQSRLDSHDDGHAHAGLWIGWTLAAVSVILRVGDVVVAKQIDEANPQR